MTRAKPARHVGDEAVAYLQQKLDGSGISQRELSEAMGLDQPAVSRILTGARRLKETEFAKAYEFIRRKLETPAPAAGLRHALETAALSLDDLAEKSGIAVPRLAELLSTRDAPVMTNREAQALEDALGRGPRFMFAADPEHLAAVPKGNAHPEAPGGFPVEAVNDGMKLIIYGPAKPDVTGVLTMTFTPIERRETPPALRDVNGAFGVAVEGDVLLPRYADGEVFFVHPGLAAGVGRWAFVMFPDDTILVGRVVEKSPSAMVLDVPGSRGRVTIDITGRLRVGKIVGTWSQ